jgi:hypothetical protein
LIRRWGRFSSFQTATQYGRVAFYALVSAALDPQDRQTGFQSLGASFPPNTSTHNGATGALSFQVNLKGKSSTTVWFAIAGSNVDKAEASGALTMALASPDGLLRDKISSRQKVLSQAQIRSPMQTSKLLLIGVN